VARQRELHESGGAGRHRAAIAFATDFEAREDLGSQLFDRLGRGVKLTEFGRALLPQAQEILRQVNNARGALESLRLSVAGRLAIGCIPTITPYFLAPRLRDFVDQYPEVDLRLVEDITPIWSSCCNPAKSISPWSAAGTQSRHRFERSFSRAHRGSGRKKPTGSRRKRA